MLFDEVIFTAPVHTSLDGNQSFSLNFLVLKCENKSHSENADSKHNMNPKCNLKNPNLIVFG